MSCLLAGTTGFSELCGRAVASEGIPSGPHVLTVVIKTHELQGCCSLEVSGGQLCLPDSLLANPPIHLVGSRRTAKITDKGNKGLAFCGTIVKTNKWNRLKCLQTEHTLSTEVRRAKWRKESQFNQWQRNSWTCHTHGELSPHHTTWITSLNDFKNRTQGQIFVT